MYVARLNFQYVQFRWTSVKRFRSPWLLPGWGGGVEQISTTDEFKSIVRKDAKETALTRAKISSACPEREWIAKRERTFLYSIKRYLYTGVNGSFPLSSLLSVLDVRGSVYRPIQP